MTRKKVVCTFFSSQPWRRINKFAWEFG